MIDIYIYRYLHLYLCLDMCLRLCLSLSLVSFTKEPYKNSALFKREVLSFRECANGCHRIAAHVQLGALVVVVPQREATA